VGSNVPSKESWKMSKSSPIKLGNLVAAFVNFEMHFVLFYSILCTFSLLEKFISKRSEDNEFNNNFDWVCCLSRKRLMRCFFLNLYFRSALVMLQYEKMKNIETKIRLHKAF